MAERQNLSVIFVAIFLLLGVIYNCEGKVTVVSVEYKRGVFNSTNECFAKDTGLVKDDVINWLSVPSLEIYAVGRFTVDCASFTPPPKGNTITFLIPKDSGKRCRKEQLCKAAVLVRNDRVNLRGAPCFDVLIGHYIQDHDGLIPPNGNFFIEKLTPYRLTCSEEHIRSLYDLKFVQKAATDIWSPVEDLINDGIAEISDQGKVFVGEITTEVNQIQGVVIEQSNKVTDFVSTSTDTVIGTVMNTTDQIMIELQVLKERLDTGYHNFLSYFHIFIRVLELIGGLFILGIAIKMYRRASGIYSFLAKWLGFREDRRDDARELR